MNACCCLSYNTSNVYVSNVSLRCVIALPNQVYIYIYIYIILLYCWVALILLLLIKIAFDAQFLELGELAEVLETAT